MNLRNQFLPATAFLFVACLFSCNTVTEKTKEVINKGGETAGKTATEFIEGVSEGIDKTLQCELVLSEELKEKGIKLGKHTIEDDSSGGENNKLVVYLIFDKEFKSSIQMKAFDKTGLECGRNRVQLNERAGEARFIDVHFDRHTHLDVKSRILFE
jgi:hypothetical protein